MQVAKIDFAMWEQIGEIGNWEYALPVERTIIQGFAVSGWPVFEGLRESGGVMVSKPNKHQ